MAGLRGAGFSQAPGRRFRVPERGVRDSGGSGSSPGTRSAARRCRRQRPLAPWGEVRDPQSAPPCPRKEAWSWERARLRGLDTSPLANPRGPGSELQPNEPAQLGAPAQPEPFVHGTQIPPEGEHQGSRGRCHF
uniref:Protein ALEX-like n=1 Tax=Phascolarctos cinereus TaxID=38626 RepID=A0A6P5LEC1_PHACI|nr:protein ALEX-like [Phascolarctos cinereus]